MTSHDHARHADARPPQRAPRGWRPFWTVGAATIATLLLVPSGDRHSGDIVIPLQGTRSGQGDASVPEILDVARQRGGDVRVRWRSVDGATGYRINLYDAGLALIYKRAVGPDTSLTIPTAKIPRDAAGLLFCAVTPLRGGETGVASMEPVVLEPGAPAGP